MWFFFLVVVLLIGVVRCVVLSLVRDFGFGGLLFCFLGDILYWGDRWFGYVIG